MKRRFYAVPESVADAVHAVEGAMRRAGLSEDLMDRVTLVVGEAAGNALRWRYVLALEVDGRTWHVDFDDWMYLHDERVMLNRSVMSKYGFRLGEVLIAFRRRG